MIMSETLNTKFSRVELPDLSNLHERHPDWPKLNLDFYFSPHGNDVDIEGIAEPLEKADILLYEEGFVVGDIDSRTSFNRIATKPHKSRRHIEKVLRDSADMPLYLGLYATGKAAGTLDIGGRPEDAKLVTKLRANQLGELAAGVDMPLSEAIKHLKDDSRNTAILHNMREQRMVENFESEITDILTKRPDMKFKKELNVLIAVGSYHTHLQRLFADAGLGSTRDFSEKQYTYSYLSQLERTYAYGREPSDDLARRAYAESMANITLRRAASKDLRDGIKAHDFHKYMRQVTDALSDDDIEAMYATYSRGGVPLSIIDDALERAGQAKLPRSNAELKVILGQHEATPKKRKFLGRMAMRRQK